METISLDGLWSVRPEAHTCLGEAGLAHVRRQSEGWLPAQVPGEIHLDLMRAGQMPDPAQGAHMPDCRWPETKSWWYRTTFELGASFIAHERQELICEGVDLYAQVFVNGRLVGEARNAFVPAVFDVRPHLRAGANELVVRLTAGSELARDAAHPANLARAGNQRLPPPGEVPNPMQAEDVDAHRNWGGRKWLRKPQFSYGWDWVDALPNLGLWRGVRLEARRHAVLHDLRLDTVLSGEQVELELAAVVENLHPWSERFAEVRVRLQPPGDEAPIERHYPLQLQSGRSAVEDRISIPDPRLWWPNGMGAQPLYGVRAEVRDADGQVCDAREFAIGLRTVEIDRSPLAEGSRFCLRVNGQEVFCRGVNTGPHDAILARVSDEKQARLVAEAQNAHANLIRINGCAVYEGEAFYQACDRAGILVWQDFMFTVAPYPSGDPAFFAEVRAEVESIIPRLRHHPSLALWCGNNEINWFFAEYNRDPAHQLDTAGQGLYSRLIPDLCRWLDPRRPYWLSSPAGGEAPNSELHGDCHWWTPAFMSPDMDRRLRHEVFDECRARFVSEYGVIGPCHADSMSEYLRPEDRHPGSLAWRLHTNTFEKETLAAAIRRHYADPEPLDMDAYSLYGQLFQALMHGGAMEALRFRKHDPVDDCQGALIWSFSDCWGETGWSILDYYLRRKASYYAFRRACAPVKVIVRRRGEALLTRLVNDTLQPFTGAVEAGWWALDGSGRETESRPVTVVPNGMMPVATAPLPPDDQRDPRRWLYAAVLRGEDGLTRDLSIWTLRPHRELVLATPDIRVTPLPAGWLEVSSPVYCHGVRVEDHGCEVLADNWFDLLPGVPVRVRAAGPDAPAAAAFQAVGGAPPGVSLAG
jgi:beta-mannosidase